MPSTRGRTNTPIEASKKCQITTPKSAKLNKNLSAELDLQTQAPEKTSKIQDSTSKLQNSGDVMRRSVREKRNNKDECSPSIPTVKGKKLENKGRTTPILDRSRPANEKKTKSTLKRKLDDSSKSSSSTDSKQAKLNVNKDVIVISESEPGASFSPRRSGRGVVPNKKYQDMEVEASPSKKRNSTGKSGIFLVENVTFILQLKSVLILMQ